MIFSNYTNIEIGDKISTRNANYVVRGVKKFDSLLGSHIEVVVRE
nr:MAG TPA: hypothetical protein [Caudoviricetes sp.]